MNKCVVVVIYSVAFAKEADVILARKRGESSLLAIFICIQSSFILSIVFAPTLW